MIEVEVARILEGALARHRAGAWREALADYGRVLAAHPTHPDALNLAASALRSSGDLAGALGLARRAAAAAPQRADVHYNLGNALSAAGALDEAGAAFARALDLASDHADAAANLGIVSMRRGDGRAAEAAYRRALAIDPGHRIAGLNLANLVGDQGATEAAIELARRVVRDHPDLAEGHYDLSLLLLRRGDLTTGFSEYEWRWRTADFSSPVRHADRPDWDGRPMAGKRLLIHAEQGLGDTIQFVRLLPLAASLGAQVTLEAPSVLVALLQGVAGAEEVTDRVEAGLFDAQAPLLGLPHRLGLTLGSMPATVPYLSADPDRVARWRERLAPDGRLLVGVGWRGNPASPADRGRSLADPAQLASLAAEGRRLIALQKLDREALEPAATPSGWRVATGGIEIEHPGPDFDAGRDAFLDSAAVMTLVDRVVVVDTALAHLAGALARPTSLLLKSVADWRWLEGRSDSPHYPTLELHRQTIAGDFTGPIAQAAVRLAGLRPRRGGA
ncbi:tetratricopeptide repeat protein [Siculibacillus lacustris]|uniref:Tetratricopeptide repeat protein n=1 Tax=Siculibacillus lacustris TaxID=1549641 RepID=A0A4Q9VF95_9HYPH|nr:tetratricopeptide repeat protein [Siculibacillus lacustris]TBW33560.1 tetratricopeptide repeat protein [Siculibacillus lacustris]